MTGFELTMTTSDGVELCYDDEGTGPAVVLVHGYAGRRGHWEYQREALLSAGYRVVALDLRGHGASAKPEHGLRLARLGQDVRELLDLLELDDVTLVAHSMGASVALAMLSISGFGRIGRFVLVDQSPKIINDEAWQWGVKNVTWDNVDDCVNFRIKWSNEEQEPQLPADSAMAQDFPADSAEGSEVWGGFDHAAVKKLFVDHFTSDWRDMLPRVPVPTWVVTSRFTNYYLLEGMEWLAEQIPGARLTVFEHSGHNPYVSEADAFNAELLDFIEATVSSPDQTSGAK